MRRIVIASAALLSLAWLDSASAAGEDPYALDQLGQAALARGDIPAAEGYFKQALAAHQATKNLDGTTRLFGNLAELCVRQQNLDCAYQNYKKAFDIFLVEDVQISLARVSLRLGQIELQRKNYASAEAFYNRSVPVYTTMNDALSLFNAFVGLATSTNRQGKAAESEQYYRQALEVAPAGLDKGVLARLWSASGIVSLELNHLNEAENALKRGLAISQQLDSKEESAANIIGLGEVYRKRGDSKSACNQFQLALDLTKQAAVKSTFVADLAISNLKAYCTAN